MGIIVVCGLLMAGGAAVALRWGRLSVVAPWATAAGAESSSAKGSALRFLWYLDLIALSGVISGLLAAGPGGRLVMRLLAVTAGDQAQGRITDAEEVVGRITTGGTIGFIIFVGLFGGVASSGLYSALRRWLPPARLGATMFGAFLLVVFATRLDPLRADNPDFGIVGPNWLAVIAFSALVLFHALVLAACAGRISRWLPLLSRRPGSIAAYAPVLLLVLTGPVFLIVVAGAVLGTVALRRPAIAEWWRSGAALTAGRLVLGAVVVVALPGFARALGDIL